MKHATMVLALLFSFLFPATMQAQTKPDCSELEKIFKTDVEEEDGICSVEIVRKSISPTHMGKKLSPETMELVFHFAFEQVDKQTAVMGELALLEEEVNPVIDQLRAGGLEVSALHNHMIFEKPRIMYVHFQGIGDMTQQAKTIKNAIDKTTK